MTGRYDREIGGRRQGREKEIKEERIERESGERVENGMK